jgi:mono/diheme cytochrome c family protein
MRLSRSTLILAALVASATGTAVAADQPSTIEKGRQLAITVCSACHVVEPGSKVKPTLDPPAKSFAEIANQPGVNATELRRFMSKTHWDEKTLPMTMPNLSLTPSQQTLLADYILSLKGR